MTNSSSSGGQAKLASQSQWAMIAREFCKRRLAVLAAAMILGLTIISILAPLLANDRPIYYVGVNRFEFREAVKTLRSTMDRLVEVRINESKLRSKNDKLTTAASEVLKATTAPANAASSRGWQTLIQRISDAIADTRLSNSVTELTRCRGQLSTTFPGSETEELSNAVKELSDARRQLAAANATIIEFPKVARLQVNLMSDALPANEVTRIRQLGRRIEQAQALSDIAAQTTEIRSLQGELRQLAGLETAVISRTRWPVLESLRWYDAAFISGIALIVLWPAWIRLLRSRSKTKTVHHGIRPAAFAPLLLPVACAGFWWVYVPQRVDRTEYKSAVLAADDGEQKASVAFRTVMWPPIAFALDEYDLDAILAPPALYRGSKSPPRSSDVKQSSRWNTAHWLGTDEQGRDVLCRMIWGGRVSLSVGLVAVIIYVTIGIVVGAVAGYFRGLCDLIVSRIIEVVICFPSFFLILTIAAMVGPGLLNIMLVIGFTGWTGIARLVRGEFLRLVDQEFVLAGRALGYSPLRLIFRHVLPNAMAPVLVSATFGIAGAILTESSLSFLGMGISVPTPSWGSLLSNGRNALDSAPWLIHFPGLAIFLTITSYNLIGEALRDAADPRLRGSR